MVSLVSRGIPFLKTIVNVQSYRCNVSRPLPGHRSCSLWHVGLYSRYSCSYIRRFNGPAPCLCISANIQWTAITTVQGGGYLQNMVTAIWPSYANFPNALPESANITSGALLMVFLYWFVQTGVSILPMYRLRYFFRFKAIVVPPAFFALFLWGYDLISILLISVQLLLMEVDLWLPAQSFLPRV